MPPPNPVMTVFEQELLRVGQTRDAIVFEQQHLDQLASLQPRLPTTLYRLEYQGIRFTDAVGLIQLPHLMIEILPKIDPLLDPPMLRTTWNNLLMKSASLPHLGNLYPQLLAQPGALITALQREFLQELQLLLKRGLLKQYRTTEGQRAYLRGKLLLSEQIRYNLIRQDRFYVRSMAHLHDHALNRPLKRALRIIEASGGYPSLARQLLYEFAEVSDEPLSQKWVYHRLDRTNHYYSRSLALAKLICDGYLGGTFAGEDYGFSLVFSMPEVFEKLIYQALHQISVKEKWSLHYQPDKYFWHRKKLRSDFVLDISNQRRVVIDTKWKALRRAEPNDEDLRQMFAYTEVFRARRGILLYPKVGKLQPVRQQFENSDFLPSSCEIQFISLTEDVSEQLMNILQK